MPQNEAKKDIVVIDSPPKGATLDGEENMAPPRKTLEQEIQDNAEIIRKKNIELTEARRSVRALQEALDEVDDVRQKYFQLGAYDPTPPEWLVGKGGSIGSRGVPICIWSDSHHGEVVKRSGTNDVNEFNKDIAKKRWLRLFDTIVDLCYEHMGRAKKEYPGIIIPLGGDMVGGDNHEELARSNDLTPLDAVEDLSDTVCGGLEHMASKFGKVYVPAVVGNHGRNVKKPPFKDITSFNYDYALYCLIQKHFRKDRKYVHIDAPKSADVHFKSFGTNYMLTHGDNLGVKGGDGIIGAIGPIMRGSIKLGQQTHKIGLDFDELILCHWHQMLWLPGVTVNNTLKGFDEYSALKLRAPPSRPSQALWFNHPEHGTTARWEVFLEDKQAPAVTNRVWASWMEN